MAAEPMVGISVRSRQDPWTSYQCTFFEDTGWECSCPAWSRENGCKHVPRARIAALGGQADTTIMFDFRRQRG